MGFTNVFYGFDRQCDAVFVGALYGSGVFINDGAVILLLCLVYGS